jgi:hypothetical protein
VARHSACFLLASLFSILSAAQQTTPPSNSDSSAQTQSHTPTQGQAGPPAGQGPSDTSKAAPAATEQTEQGKVPGTSNDRLFKVLPNFLTVKNAQLKPLTTGEKFKVVALGTFDPVQYPWWGLLSAIGQAENSEPAYGQSWAAYGKRYGTIAADSMIENFMVGAVFSSALRQDPRFYQSGKGGVATRTGYAVSRIFVTRTDSGHARFNYSEIFGSATAAAISTYSYHPRSTYLSTPSNPHLFVGSDRTLVNAGETWGTQVGLDAITIVIKEFWPDVQRKMARKHKNDVLDAPTPKL